MPIQIQSHPAALPPIRPRRLLGRTLALTLAIGLLLPTWSDLQAAPQHPTKAHPQPGKKSRAAKTASTAAVAGIGAAASSIASTGTDYTRREEVRTFIADMVARHQFDESSLKQTFSNIRFDAGIIKLMTPPPTSFKRSWAVYRTRFLDSTRIDAGVRFWRTYAGDIKRAADQYGVPEEIIVGIIGVETIYGRITGNYRVIDALTVLSFDYARRADYFRGELEQFLLFARDDKIDPDSVRGSFAGAIGLPQFMPTSLRKYAVDYDNNGHIDLRGSPVDAIGSVARFLSEHGWQRDQPVRFRALFENESAIKPLVDAGIEPQFTLTQMATYGIASPEPVPADMKLALIDLPNADDPMTYYLGAPNFYVITRYNRSSFYAMAVYELAQAVRDAR